MAALTPDMVLPESITCPSVDGAKVFLGGKISPHTGDLEDVHSPILNSIGEKYAIGRLAQMHEPESLLAVESAQGAWRCGQGLWPQMSMEQRIAVVEDLVRHLMLRRTEIVDILTWEICKSTKDAAMEFDRTMLFIDATIKELRSQVAQSSWETVSGVIGRFKRAPIGVMLCLGPFNYPFNETYASMIPALLMGNVVILKLPTVGALSHVLTMEAYAAAFPPGVVNFVSGPGRTTVPTMMKTGHIDILAFIGSSKAADNIIKDHPHPHRLKSFLSLEGKNLGIVTEDADIATAASEVLLGSTTYNGQRCTAIKLVMVHSSIAQKFVDHFSSKVSELVAGLPWTNNVAITPLPEPNKCVAMKELIDDAVSKGATVVNAAQGGGRITGNLMQPAVVYPVTASMRLWHEEQFGPVVPIAVYNTIEDVYDYLYKMPYGQQAAVFTSNGASVSALVDILSTTVGRINVNTQCSRSPDVFPFSGRRSSALGTMSISETLKQFSIETLIAAKSNEVNLAAIKALDESSVFLKQGV